MLSLQRKFQNHIAMKKSELKGYLENGGCFTIEVNNIPFKELLAYAEATQKGKGQLTLLKTERLFKGEIETLCTTAPGRVHFPDKPLED